MIDLLTVTYGKELPLLRLQANSIRRFIDRKLINKIHIINNDDVDIFYVRDWYGDLSDKVEFSHYTDYDINIIPHIYSSHQILKCLYSRRSSRYYMILDSKNFFVKPVDESVLFKDGLPIASLYGRQGLVKRPWEQNMWTHTCSVLQNYHDLPLLYSTPFIADKQVMMHMIELVKKNTGMSLTEYFITENKLGIDRQVFEFFLYSAAIKDYSVVHSIRDRFVSSVWPETIKLAHAQPNYIKQDTRLIASGIHRNAWNSVGEEWMDYLEQLEILDKDSFRQIQLDML